MLKCRYGGSDRVSESLMRGNCGRLKLRVLLPNCCCYRAPHSSIATHHCFHILALAENLHTSVYLTQMRVLSVLAFLAAFLVSYAVSSPLRLSDPARRPLVIWHGLGDSYASPGMLQFISLIKEMHPGIFIHSVYLNESLKEDERAGFVRAFRTSPCSDLQRVT